MFGNKLREAEGALSRYRKAIIAVPVGEQSDLEKHAEMAAEVIAAIAAGDAVEAFNLNRIFWWHVSDSFVTQPPEFKKLSSCLRAIAPR